MRSVHVDKNPRESFNACKTTLKQSEAPKRIGVSLVFLRRKNFDQDQKVNQRNDRWLCADSTEVPTVMHTKFPATVMVFGVVSREGHIISSSLFSTGL